MGELTALWQSGLLAPLLVLVVVGVSVGLVARLRVRRYSRFMLGADKAAEAALAAVAGVEDLPRFFVLSQRLLWGFTQADLIRVDLDAAAAQLLREFDGFFVAHLVVAFIQRSRGENVAANRALARACELAPPGHPLAYLLPTQAEWAGDDPEVTLEEVVPGRIWRHACYYGHGGSPLHEIGYATIVRRRDGGLVIYNPVAMSPAIRAAIAALGEVTHLVIGVKFHNMFIAEAQAAFPGAKTFGVPGHATNPPSRDLHFDGFIRAGAPLFPGEIDEIVVAGHQFEEVVMIDRPTRTAIIFDFVMSNLRGAPEHPFWVRIYTFCWGIDDRVAMPAYQVIMWTNFLAVRRGVRALLAADVERALAAHVPTQAMADDCAGRLREAFGWVDEIGLLGHLVFMRDFFVAQPSFLRDFVRYLLRR
ncbi:MAG: hypothetical protein R3A79_20970 [Nannocystaceae bacterium]